MNTKQKIENDLLEVNLLIKDTSIEINLLKNKLMELETKMVGLKEKRRNLDNQLLRLPVKVSKCQ